MMSSSPYNKEEKEKEKTWIGLIDESVHTFDDIDIGDIDAVSRDSVVVKNVKNMIRHFKETSDNKARGM
jgi:hypothetical protein